MTEGQRIAPGWTPESAAAFTDLVAPLSNWGRWGDEDELGTLNLLTPERAAAAARLVIDGVSHSLARTIGTAPAPDNPAPLLRLMRASGDAAAEVGGSHASDWLGLAYHGFAVTHLDAHAHQFFGGQMYNGRPARAVSTRDGARAGAVTPAAAAAPVGRGLLLDVPRAFDRPWLEPGEGLGPDELDAVAAAQASPPRPGDIVLIRTGRDPRAARHGALDPIAAGSPGLTAAALTWLRRHDIALLGSDVQADVMTPGGAPHPMPVHAGALVHLGLPLVDNLAVEELAAACAARQRWEFLCVVAPLPLEQCTGSPVAPVAVL